jgi:hypothetical protein
LTVNYDNSLGSSRPDNLPAPVARSRHMLGEQELNRANIAFRKNDNAFLAVDNVEALQAAGVQGSFTSALSRTRSETRQIVLWYIDPFPRFRIPGVDGEPLLWRRHCNSACRSRRPRPCCAPAWCRIHRALLDSAAGRRVDSGVRGPSHFARVAEGIDFSSELAILLQNCDA